MEYFYEQIVKYVESKFSVPEFPDFAFYFAAFINPKDTKNRFIRAQLERLAGDIQNSNLFESLLLSKSKEVDKIHDILYKFTHDKMTLFFEYKEYAHLFKYYVKTAQDFIPKGFREQLDLMLNMTNHAEDFSD